MHADQLLPAVVAAVALACLLIAGRADGLEEYAPTGAVSLEMEPLSMNQNPGQYLPRPEVMPLPTDLLSRPDAGGDGEEYVPQVEVVPEVVVQPGDPLAEALGGGSYVAEQPATEPVTFGGDFYRAGMTPSSQPPAKPSSPDQKKYGGSPK
ncbi:hypothetical protein CFC21_069543 [Triticum aestivum]|uniref:Uncharacterized protein n=2 Tax=Triticum aestivum TaxID=4565 RepID=A0A3B6LFE0_WHEAT|nr:hypothetical protein CFC21_069543 [Triticum aestivum]